MAAAADGGGGAGGKSYGVRRLEWDEGGGGCGCGGGVMGGSLPAKRLCPPPPVLASDSRPVLICSCQRVCLRRW